MKRNILLANDIARQVHRAGGAVYYVGGCVRDRLLGSPMKDIDIEVHGITPAALEKILDGCGQRLEMGKSFGVYGLKGYTLDIAMPRKETAIGRGHRDFKVEVDPFTGTRAAARRRDFTIGALMQDVLSEEIVDHFGGLTDLKNGLLRHVDAQTFTEDPLRVLRAAQFAARFDFTVAEETIALCSTMHLDALPRERVAEETKKALLRAKRPSIFFRVLRQMGQLEDWFKELSDLIGVPQNPAYHAEGDVWEHTLLTLDAAARRRENAIHPYAFMLAALTHDFGKAVTTAEKDGVLHAYRHETQGVPLVHQFMQRLLNQKDVTRYVLNMCELHMQPGMLAAQHSSRKATNRMFDQSVCPEDLIGLSMADLEGSRPLREQERQTFLTERLAHFRQTMAAPYVTGQDLVNAGLQPDRHFARILQYAHKLRLAGVSKEAALKQTLAYSREVRK